MSLAARFQIAAFPSLGAATSRVPEGSKATVWMSQLSLSSRWSSSPFAASQTRTSPPRSPAATRRPSWLQATASSGTEVPGSVRRRWLAASERRSAASASVVCRASADSIARSRLSSGSFPSLRSDCAASSRDTENWRASTARLR